ncbi:MAG: metallophosphoesterase [Candidatus Micrarchaeia archaeon]
MRVRFIFSKPAVIVGKNLILADLHFGIEAICLSYSVAMKKIEKDIESIRDLVKKFKIKNLIIAGDFKHTIPKRADALEKTEVETEEVKEIERKIKIKWIINKMKEFVNLIIVSGNHDGGIREKVPEYFIGKIGIFHGHRKPSKKILKCEKIICGHVHPTVSIGGKVEKVFLIGKLDESFLKQYKIKKSPTIIVIPSFNDLIYGSKIENFGSTTGPIFKKGRFKILSVYLLSGTKIE